MVFALSVVFVFFAISYEVSLGVVISRLVKDNQMVTRLKPVFTKLLRTIAHASFRTRNTFVSMVKYLFCMRKLHGMEGLTRTLSF